MDIDSFKERAGQQEAELAEVTRQCQAGKMAKGAIRVKFINLSRNVCLWVAGKEGGRLLDHPGVETPCRTQRRICFQDLGYLKHQLSSQSDQLTEFQKVSAELSEQQRCQQEEGL